MLLLDIKFQKEVKESNNGKLKEANEYLTSDLKTVYLKANISKGHSVCKAKVDENGKIICTISANFEKRFNNIEEFLNYFYLKNE